MTRRIARIITRLNIGGPAIQAINLSRELRAAGFETLLVHGHLGDREGSMTTLMPLDGISAQYVDDLVRPISPIHDLRAFNTIYRALCAWKPEIVHTHMAKAGAVGRLAAVAYNRTAGRRRPAKLIHTYHGHVFEGYFGSPSTRAFLMVERWLAKRSTALIAISPQVRHDLIETYHVTDAHRVRIVPLGFSLDKLTAIDDNARAAARRALDIPEGALVVTTVGRLTSIKQHSLFLAAAAVVSRELPGALFLIVGDGELRGDLEADAKAKGIGDRVRFLGWRGDLETIYGATDVFVLTSRNEGTPVALIEAMASAVASVSTDVGGVRDVIATPESGTLVPFGDPAALSAAIVQYGRSTALRANTGRQARAFVATRFDSRRLVRDIGQLYADLLG